ncbi:MAG: putative molybdenum carrier protein [Bacteroidales bacterium]|jgi:hypothetical protein|nr:putative molybdenum carrier protein [Bacteroidales bacterium]NLM91727.1 molybdenum cofactor carrier [Bacteroidales bacterium]
MENPLTIITGGQTGVDQAALQAAGDAGLETGGWCPPGRLCESGVIPPEFPLRETEKEFSDRAPDIPRSLRTERNVSEAGAVLILIPGEMVPDPGTRWTRECASHFRKPLLVADPFDESNIEIIFQWIRACQPKALHVAGPAESRCPGIFDQTYSLLKKVFLLLIKE